MKSGIGNVLAAMIFFLFFSSGMLAASENSKEAEKSQFPRVVSTAPSITEILYALGAERQVVGVTPYCHHPVGAEKKPITGSALGLNFEKILAIQPDLIILSKLSKTDIHKKLKRLKLKYVEIKHSTISEILQSIRKIGRLTGREIRAKELSQTIQSTIESYRRPQEEKSPRVALVIDVQMSGQRLKNFTLAGKATFYDEILTVIGARNVVRESVPSYPQYSRERMIRENPDVIIHLVSDKASDELVKTYEKAWAENKYLKAVVTKRIFVDKSDYLLLPGPRVGKVVEALSKIINNEKTP